ncbi:Ca-activated chloride channel family protein [Motilibacter peucedani]|uniref:Ca-activated chloride channel family protein n=1 Tax=Motilibacter peucedani TaxID=598650 RepID=A0A420XNJ7_9ACTN|nr:VWA domain-containing protein [Motilibacter peucedani]RKS73742.1 Ca-activated chloride channel family protein [Motilibacter peucedani]
MPSSFSLEAPGRLWALLGLVALVVAAAVLAARRRRGTDAYAVPALRASAAPRASAWPRRVLAAVFGVAVLVLTTGFARPSVEAKVGHQHAVVMIALDTSTSMEVDDVSPNRFAAAKETAKEFIRKLPSTIDVGLVGYNATAALVAAPTSDHEQVAAAVDTLTMKGGTAMGDALELSLDAALRDLASAGATKDDGSPPAARLVLLSDGGNTTGSPLESAIQDVADAQVAVSTIALGTESGEGKVFDGRQVTAPVDYSALQQVADGTGGTAYRAADADRLSQVYSDIGTQVVTRTERKDVSTAFAGAGLGLLALVAASSLIWSGRLL